MIKEIFSRLYGLMFRPTATWTKMSEVGEAAHALFFTRFLYPIMGVAALSCFTVILGADYQSGELEKVLRAAIVEFVKFFIGFYLVVFLWKEFASRVALPYDKETAERFFGSLLAVYMAVEIVVNILPRAFSFLEYAVFGIIYIVWTGTAAFLHLEEDKRRISTIIITVLVLAVPWIIRNIFYLLMPAMN